MAGGGGGAGAGAGGAEAEERTKHLSDEISVDQIVHSLMDPFTSTSNGNGNDNGGGPAADTKQQRGAGGGLVDEVSVMTDDRSRFSQLSTTVGAVFTQSLALLRGENPELEEQLEEQQRAAAAEGRQGPHQSSPINTLTLTTIPSEMPLQNEEDGTEGRTRSRIGGDADSTASIDFLQDDPKDMTYGRIIALKLMSKGWYNPQAAASEENEQVKSDDMEDGRNAYASPKAGDGPGVTPIAINSEQFAESPRGGLELQATVVETHEPSLEKAWAYFEHVTLPRYIFRPKDPNYVKKPLLTRMLRKMQKGDKKLDIAEPGQDDVPTKLYSPIFTPLKQMGDFGLGIGLYFSTLRSITVMCLIAGLINIPNFLYYSSSTYSDLQPGVPKMLKGSAVCTRQEFVPCPTCTLEQFKDDPYRIATATNIDGTTIYFALKNMCADGATFQQGMVNYSTLIFVILAVFLVNVYQRKKEIQFDEDEQTAQDYSITIANPPNDATDPAEWKEFFDEKFNAHVTVCTVGLDNDLLVRSLVERREILEKLKLRLDPGTSMDVLNLARIAAEAESKRRALDYIFAMLAPGLPELFGRLAVLNAKIQGLAQQNYPATNVFVTFETEKAQRDVLAAYSIGTIPVWRNNVNKLPNKDHLFRGDLVLDCFEADEPSTIRWQDLNEKFKAKLKQVTITTFVTLCAIVLVAFIVMLCRDRAAAFGAFAISISNSIFPMFAKFLTNMESHASEGQKQTSLYVKIAGFRWVNTAIVITIITPFTSTLMSGKDHLLNGVSAIFFAEIVTTNAIQLLDPMGHINRHFLAPRAKTQEGMNLLMQGALYELAERYTNMTKLLFLALWYCSIYPMSLFLCAMATFINFFSDRFSLMRTWKPSPKLGNRISRMSRKYFFPTAVIAMAVIGSYSWTGFPYDNLCDTDETVNDSSYYGRHKITTADKSTSVIVTVGPRDDTYRFCLQDLIRMPGVVAFPALPYWQPEGSEWMTDEQEHLTSVYGWTSLGVIAFVVLVIVFSVLLKVRNLFRGTYDPTGKDMKINFSDVPSISSYIPQVHSAMFTYPLLAADIDNIGEELFEWEDSDRPYGYYDLTRDAEDLLRGTAITKDASKTVFSRTSHWPPAPIATIVEDGQMEHEE